MDQEQEQEKTTPAGDGVMAPGETADSHAADAGDAESGGDAAHAEHAHGAHAEHEHEHEFHGLKAAFRERVIAFRTMDRPLRLMAGLAVVQLLVSAVLIPLRDLHLPVVPVYVADTHLVQSPLALYVAAICLLALSWGYLVVGALQAHPLLRLAGLALYTWAIEMVHPTYPPQGIEVAWDALAAVPWLVGLWSIGRDLRANGLKALALRRGGRRSLPWPTVVLVALSVLALYGASFLGDRHNAMTLMFTSKVTIQLSSLQFALIPILFLAGVDFAEWGELTMERISVALDALRRPAVSLTAAAVGALVVLGIVGYDYRHALFVSHHVLPLVEDAAMGLVALALLAALAWAARLRLGLPAHLPYAALVVMTLLYSGLLFVVSFASTVPATQRAIADVKKHPTLLQTTTYRHETEPRFTLEYPQMWQVQVLEEAGPRKPLLMVFNGIASGNPGVIYLVRTSARGEPTFARMRDDWFAFCCAKKFTFRYDHPQKIGPWQVIHFTEYSRATGKPMVAGREWYLAQGDGHWMFQDETGTHLQSFDASVFQNMVLSFRLGDAPAPKADEAAMTASDANSGDVLVAETAPVLLLAAVVGLVVLLRRMRRGRGGAASAGLLFVTVFCGYNAIAAAHSVAVTAFARLGPLAQIPHVSMIGIQIAVALTTLAGVAWAATTRRTGPRWASLALLALGLNGALQILAWVYDLFTSAMDVSGRFGVAQAVVIILALTWDVLMSGETVTNRDGRLFPRSSRVLLFFGYMCFTAVNLLYFSTLQVQATGERLEAQFESEAWVQQGIVLLGVPLLLTLFLLGASRWMSRGATAAAPPDPLDDDEQGAAEPAPAPQADEDAVPVPA